ncbi:MAG: glycoside hydrolase family 32 protein [Bryobacteraceae bacterium]|nr:glycoside hydrolase family 32 protein [Bryobacteraceae bacterium]
MRTRIIAAAALLAAAGWSAELFRPLFHFSPAKNWTNDPCGLVFFSGEYHLFFQHNPSGDQWGNMSWGHAVSRDLRRWQELPVAIPTGADAWIFTGSTVVDWNNSSGFCRGGKPCLVAIYTGDTGVDKSKPSREHQNLAYSNDNGRTWTKYEKNPVLDPGLKDFRDPKVLWHAPTKRWIMALALPTEHKAAFYASADLKSWRRVGEFGPAGATGGIWECPDLFEVDGKWVLKIGLNPGHIAGGSGEQYFVGRFDGTTFVSETKETKWLDYGRDCYCALTFSDTPRGQKPVMLGWMSNWQYAGKTPTSPWRGQMTLPRRLSLKGDTLLQQPAAGVARPWRPWNGKPLAAGQMFELEIEPAGDTLDLRVLKGAGAETAIGYAAGKLSVDRTKSGAVAFDKTFPSRTEAPLAVLRRLHVVVDRMSVEVFANDGEVVLTNIVFPPAAANGVEINSPAKRLRWR